MLASSHDQSCDDIQKEAAAAVNKIYRSRVKVTLCIATWRGGGGAAAAAVVVGGSNGSLCTWCYTAAAAAGDTSRFGLHLLLLLLLGPQQAQHHNTDTDANRFCLGNLHCTSHAL